MKLWILRPNGYNKDNYKESGEWKPWYDKCFGVVVRAETSGDAREIAADGCSDEGRDAWLLAENSTCRELTADGGQGVVIEDVWTA
jgi:hypothetical protein